MFKTLIIFISIFILPGKDSLVIARNGSPGDDPRSFSMPYHNDAPLKAALDSVQVDWVRQYVSGFVPAFDFANAIAVDASGNVLVAGSSYGSNELNDAVTIKYDSSGDTLWVRRYNGPGNNWDDAQAVAIDGAGNVYVTGKTYSDSTLFNYLTIKYSADGALQWVAQYDGPSNNDDGAVAVSVDGSGNVYVTGYSWQSGTSWDYLTVKYNSSGQQQWIARYNGPGNIADFATGLALDPSGNVYVTGTSDDLSVNFYPAYATVKYNAEGVEQWVEHYKVLWSYANAIAVDDSGNAYVTGRSYVLGTYYDFATIKYNTLGEQQWVKRYQGYSDDEAFALIVDGAGNVYVTGEGGPATVDYVTVKYNSSGGEEWIRTYDGPGNAVDRATSIALDTGGNIYVTGESRGTSGDDDFATLKYSEEGDEQWVVRYSSGPGEIYDLASAIAVDTARNVYVTGRSNQTGGSVITTIKYTEVPVAVQEHNTGMPEGFALGQNYPNPFYPATTITFSLPVKSSVLLEVSDAMGKVVATMVSEELPPGTHAVQWNATGLPGGVYFCRMQVGSFIGTKRLVIIR